MSAIKWPFGLADVSQALSATGAQAINIANDLTIVDGVTTPGTASRTINLTIGADITPGSRLIVKSATTGSSIPTVFGTGCIAPTITGVTGKTFVQELVYDGTNFVATSTPLQIN